MPPQKAGVRAKVLFEYKAENDDELSLVVGDIIQVTKQTDDGWWEGEHNGEKGVFPDNFVELIGGDEHEEPADKDPGEEDIKQTKAHKAPVGFGLGNIFAGGAISLRKTGSVSAGDKPKKADPPPPGPVSPSLSLPPCDCVV